jgi:hypothetical protein
VIILGEQDFYTDVCALINQNVQEPRHLQLFQTNPPQRADCALFRPFEASGRRCCSRESAILTPNFPANLSIVYAVGFTTSIKKKLANT